MRVGLWCAIVALASGGRTAEAFRLAVPLSELCGLSTLVVVGEVTTLSSQWSSQAQGSLETMADVSVVQVLRGGPRSDVVITSPGGEMGDLVQTVEEAARLRVDVRYLLLLTARPHGSFVVTGGEAGAVPVPIGIADPVRWARQQVGACDAP
jgi:hypothetical protein